MSYCINPFCQQRQNPGDADNCLACGNPLLINGRIRLLQPLRSLTENPYTYTDIFEVEETDTSLYSEPQRRVMKVLKWTDDSKSVELLQRESIILQTLDHPGIPKSNKEDYFTFTLNGNILVMHCLVMQKLEGEDLRQWIKTYGQISQNVALDWLSQLVNILDNVHRNKYFHRDIKPDNIIYQPNGKIALIDFGGAREISRTFLAKLSTNGGTSTGTSIGYEITAVRSAYYSPLEQINGQAVPQSDFYALGRTFVHLVTGISLNNIKSDEKTGKLLWRDKAPHIDKSFADLLDDMMAPFPGQRPQTTQIILQRLQRLPFQSKLNRVIKSNLFKCFLLGAFIVTVTGFYKGINLALSTYYFNQAARYLDKPNIAKKYYELAIKYNSEDVDAYSNLAVACQQLQDTKCMTDNYEKVFKLNPNDWVSHYNLGNFYDEQDKYDLAEQQYKLAIQYSNNRAMNAVNNLSRLKNRQRKYSEAAGLALEGLKRTSDTEWLAALYKNLGWARLKQQRYAEAKEYLLKSIKLDSERVDAYCLLAQTQEALGELKYARAYWEVCLMSNVNSGLPEIQEWRQQVLQRLFKEN